MSNNNLGHNNSGYTAQGLQLGDKQPLTQMLTPQYSYKINQATNAEPTFSKETPQKANMVRLDPSFKEKNKQMYNSSMNFGSGGADGMLSLSNLGRKVNEPVIEKDQYLNINPNDNYSNSAGKNLGLPPKDYKMASSAIFGLDNAQQGQMNKFPVFNLGSNLNNQKPTQTPSSNNNQQSISSKPNETVKQKRQRELMEMFEIKKQLDDLTKKIKTVQQKNKTNQAYQTNVNKQTPKPASISYPTTYQSSSSSSTSSSSSSNFSNKFHQYKNLPGTSNTNDQPYKTQSISPSYNDQAYTQPKKTQQSYLNPTSTSINPQKSQVTQQKPYSYQPKYDQYDKKYDNFTKNNGTTSSETYSSFKIDSFTPKTDSSSNNSYLNSPVAQYNYSGNTNSQNNDYKARSVSTTTPLSDNKPSEYNFSLGNTNTNANTQGVFKKKQNIGYFEQPEKKQNFLKKPNEKPVEQLKKPQYHPETSTRNLTINNNINIRKIQSYDYFDPKAHFQQLKQIKYSDFIIGKKMGKGMFGQVLLVKHKYTGWVCGLKVMSKKVIKQQSYVGQIARQLSIQFYLQHRNILQLYGYFQDEKNFYLLIEFCSGGQLLQRLKQERRMNERDVALIIKQVCQGIDYIHRQLIIHRDIKPENILFNMGVVKICDFGWAVYRGFGMRKTASGSPLYYPPEIVKGEQYDDKIDIWCIGMMAYECIMGKIPFKVYTEMDLKRIVSDQITFPQWVDVTNEAKDFILKTLKKNPQERMEIKQMLKHPFLTKHQEAGLSKDILDDFKRVLG